MEKSEQVERFVTARQRLKANRSIRVSTWALDSLVHVQQRLQSEIATNPGAYPGYAGRNISLSDVITLLCERATT